MSAGISESIVEDAALEWFAELGYALGHGPQLAPGEPAAERDSFGEVVLVGRLREAIRRLNPAIPEEACEEALRKVLRVATPSFTQANRAFHRMLRDGVPVEYPRPDGSIAGDHVRLVDFADARTNDWLTVNQFTVIEGQHNRRPDIVVYLGLADQLKQALATYTESGGQGGPTHDTSLAIAGMLEKHGIACDMMHEELISLAKELDAAAKRGQDLGLTDDEVAFYDALAANASAVKIMGDDKLKVIATELVTKIRQSVTIDWTLRESARAKIKVMVKRILNKFGYPPDLQEEAVKTILAQAELLCAEWV